MKTIDDFLPRALELVEQEGIAKDGKVPNQYKGYIASFGTAIRQLGLRPAVALFSKNEDQGSGREEDPRKVMKAVYELICPGESGGTLLSYLCSKTNEEIEQEEQRIMNAAIALKLAIRTFKIVKDEQ